MKVSIFVKKFICYMLGLVFISIGINLSKMSGLGISPISSVPRVCELVWGFTLGTTIMIIYVFLVLLQLLLLRRNFKWRNVLGILLSVVFGTLVDFFGIDPNAVGHLMLNFPRPENYAMRFIYTVLSAGVIGLGVFLYLRPKWIPMPAEGLADAISKTFNKTFGDCKSAVDTTMITLAFLLQFIFLGGFGSFTGPQIAVREGTIILAIAVGQTVKFIAKRYGEKLDRLIN